MEEKQKAKELIEKFRNYVDFTNDKDETCLKSQYDRAKQCALICVDEIVDTLCKTHPRAEYEDLIFWQNVKTEIENYEP